GVLKEVFRGKFVEGLKKLQAEHKLAFHGTLTPLQNPKALAAWLRPLFRSSWVVYSKRPFGGAQHALRYLGQYTHRVAISNHRLVALADAVAHCSRSACDCLLNRAGLGSKPRLKAPVHLHRHCGLVRSAAARWS